MIKKISLTLLFLFVLCSSGHCENITKVVDGDTVYTEKHKIRLYGVDAPEISQAYGVQAKDFLQKLVSTDEITIEFYGYDYYGRSIAILYAGKDIVQEKLVRSGLVWVDSKYCKEAVCVEWKYAEIEAKKHGLGLWQDEAPIAPWEYRRGLKNKKTKE